MSAETPNPQPGDRVRVTFEGTVAHLDDHDRVATVKTSDDQSARGQYVPLDATVVVLERADDPTIGEIRAVAPSADGTPKTAVKVGSRLSTNPGERCMWVIVETGEMLADGNVSGLGDVIGAVPDSPAAKVQSPARRSVRVPNEPHGLSEHLLQVIRERVTVGDKWGAVDTLVHCTLMDREQAASYVESMSEYQTYLAAHGESRAPRVFPADGPEPPTDVVALKSSARPDGHVLKRCERGGWLWTGSPQAAIDEKGLPWPATARGNLREVV